MFGLRSVPRSFWLLAIVIAVGALMVLPAGSFLTARGATGSPAVLAAGTSSSVPLASTNTPVASEVNALVQSRPSLSSTPWIENLLNPAKDSTPLVSLPNLALLENPAKVVNGEVALSYTTQPAPMGIADFGLGANGPYALNASSILGSITFETPPAATNPGAQEVIDPTGQTLGYIGSPYTFGIQLNTILQNVSLPGVSNGTFWTQNVVNMNSTGIHFVQDVFNFTYGSDAVIPASGTIVSGCSGFDIPLMLEVYGGVYQCVGGTVPITAADFPLTLNFYNNATVVNGQDVLTFGYLFTGAHGFLSGGTLDQLVFNTPATPSTPSAGPPQFTINGYQTNPFGLYNDAELTLAGGIGGANGVFSSIDGTMSLETANSGSGYANVPSAYDFGDDTGETSTGVATYWTGTGSSNAVAHENSGPSLLYGLWNSPADISAAPGAIHVSGTISPDYGFVFAGNVNPSVSSTNLSYVPTVPGTGGFSTLLPPPAPGSVVPGGWYFQSWAPKATERNGANAAGPGPVTSSVSNYDITLAPSTSLNAPLYMDGDAQAASLANAVTRSSRAPFDFSNLVISPALPFRHVNDYGFPTFVLFQAQGLSEPVQVNDLSQSTTSTTYIYDSVVNVNVAGFPSPPAVFYGLQNYSTQFNIWDSRGAQLTNLILVGEKAFPGGDVEGGVVLLWDDTDASVADVSVSNASYGIFVGDSYLTSVRSVASTTGSNALDDVGSYGTSARGVTANGPGSFGVYVLGGSYGSYDFLEASGGAYGMYAGGYVGPAYYNAAGSTGAHVSGVTATDAATAAFDSISVDDTFTNVVATGDAYGAIILLSSGDTVIGASASNGSWGVEIVASPSTLVFQVTAVDNSYGVYADETSQDTISHVLAVEYSVGVLIYDSTDLSISHVIAIDHSIAIEYE